ncbi:zinc-ribbon domain-containing protein [Streptomyces sp. AK02-04a]|uniref:zinc-ribbon domain-containing protein n=1 Tax=Streptomyces sp. AK02-04a TaxID=3028649 RepID=UPI0029B80664|nr:zinc-ribbon domain-containing protein [Streptomyces sp. AK02-04a]MDX3762298.1 zinc-ribbon domain-containing protein [Streptomyces sp. AK02-04a]
MLILRGWALVAAEPLDGSEVRHEDDHGVEQCLRDASVGHPELGVVDAVEGGLFEVAVAALVLAAQPGSGLLPQRGEQGIFLPPLGQHGAWDSDALPGASSGPGAAAGSGCPYCAGHLVSVTNALATHAPYVSAEFDPSLNDGLTPWQVTASSGRNITWRCRQNPLHTWTTCVSARTGPSRSGCPHCSLYRVSRRQLALGFELRALLPDTEPTGAKLTAGARRWEADILIPAHRVVVEFDGRYWHARPGAADRDRRKSEAIRGAGYTLIRVREEPLPVLHPHDVSVPAGDTKAAVVAVLNRIVEITGRPIPAADAYAATPGLLAEAAFHAHVDAALRDDSAHTLW